MTTETKVVNIKKTSETGWDIYIGRQNNHYNLEESTLANPFTLKKYSRETSINLYTLYIFYRYLTDEMIRNEVENLYGKRLACWCKPKDCHGDVLKELTEITNSENKSVENYIKSQVESIQTSYSEGTEYKNRIRRILNSEDY